LKAVEAALAALRPAPAALDRDALLYRAGRAAAPRVRRWQLATAFSSAVAAGLAAVLLLRPGPPPVEHIVYVTAPRPEAPPTPSDAGRSFAAPADPDPWPSTPYTRLEDRLLQSGLDGLPEPPPPPPAEPPADFKTLLRSL
jgi:hypothetical protein